MLFKVGQKTLRLEDTSRRNWSNTGVRPLLTEVWYPAIDEAQEQELLFGGPEPLFCLRGIAKDAEMRAEPRTFPVILLSHGTGGSALQMGWLGRSLAAHGYVTVAVNHHGNTSVEPYLAQGFLLWWERAKDLTIVLDHLLEDVVWGPRLNAARVGVAGFSLGGYTAIELVGGRCSLPQFEAFCQSPERDILCDGPREFPEAIHARTRLATADPLFQESVSRHNQSYKDERCRAAFVMNPALGGAFTAEGLAEVRVPVHIVVGAGDTVVPPKTNGYRFAELLSSAALTLLEGPIDHYAFLCEATEAGKRMAPDVCVDNASVDRRVIHDHVADLAKRFFERHLAG
jgi:predicted dienelactone hydrolase